MARPRKNNADYFSHDNDMRNDDKILSVRRKFGHEGYSIWNMLLEKLCKSDGFIIDIDNVSIELLSGDFVVEPEKLKEIIDYFIYIRLIFRDGDSIFSQKLVDRFEGLLSKRQRDIEYRQGKQKENIVIDDENPQSKVKYSKVKESKVKENKVKEIITNKKDFDIFWDIYPHARSSKKSDAKKHYNESKYKDDEIITEVKYINRCIRYGIIDGGFVKGCALWMRDFVPTNTDIKDQNIKKIVFELMKNKDPEKSQELINDFGSDKINKFVKEYNKQNNTVIFK